MGPVGRRMDGADHGRLAAACAEGCLVVLMAGTGAVGQGGKHRPAAMPGDAAQ